VVEESRAEENEGEREEQRRQRRAAAEWGGGAGQEAANALVLNVADVVVGGAAEQIDDKAQLVEVCDRRMGEKEDDVRGKQSRPGKRGFRVIISTRMQPTDHTSTESDRKRHKV
jgi:hypothetical protein